MPPGGPGGMPGGMGGPGAAVPVMSDNERFDKTLQILASKKGEGVRVKRDGTILRSKAEIVKDYDESALPYPIKNIWKLDYCWRLTYTMWKHSFVISLPTTMVVFIYRNMPECWKYTRKTFPYARLAFTYVYILFALNTVNTTYSLAFEDYC